MGDWIGQRVQRRRARLAQAGAPRVQGPAWGLALSGGGIRSATFGLGLVQALARRGLLLRFDLLSTVSGGGYVGAMLGRLFDRARTPAQALAVERALGRNDHGLAWWLRANGRYLVPRGLADTLFATATYLRSVLAVHVELGVLAVLLGCALVGLDLALWALLAQVAPQVPGLAAWLQGQAPQWPRLLLPAPLLLLPAPAWLALVLSFAYWIGPGARAWGRVLPALVLWLGFAVLLVLGEGIWRGSAADVGRPVRDALWCSALVICSAWLAAWGVAWLMDGAHGRDEATLRLRLTRGLSRCLQAGAVLVLAAALDRAAWALAFELQAWLGAGVGLAVAAALLRALLPLLSPLLQGQGRAGSLLRLAGLLGWLTAFALAVCWVALVQRAVFGAVFVVQGREMVAHPLYGQLATWLHLDVDTAVNVGLGALTLGLVGLPPLLYAVFTRRQVVFLNDSSLHAFYRARLVRSHLGAANPARFPQPDGTGRDPLAPMPPEPPHGHRVARVGDTMAGDDLPMARYRPHRGGGPLHLITACINQTRDPRGGLHNRDRRGLPLVVGPLGLARVGNRPWQRAAVPGGLTLGQWMAISGAAFAPGLGSQTRGGVAALMTFAGARLGVWWDGLSRQRAPRAWPKAAGLLDELTGDFPGTEGRHWYLTDGAHVENTGVWALLQARCGLIVVADCGADPEYRFEDLSHLVRLASIELGVRIDMLQARTGLPPAFARFGSLEDLKSGTSQACLALARVHYPEAGAEPGLMVVVKPNVWAGLPMDLAAYLQAQPTFPQQSTADQFFDEAQWEAYRRLGEELGGLFEAGWLQQLPQVAVQHFESGARAVAPEPAAAPRPLRLQRGSDGRPRLVPRGDEPAPSPPAPERRPGQGLIRPVATTLSLGAVATAALTTWQALEGVRQSEKTRQGDEAAALKAMTEEWAALPPAPEGGRVSPQWPAYAAQLSKVATVYARTADAVCARGATAWFLASPLASHIFERTLARCDAALAEGVLPACEWLLDLSRGQSQSCLRRTGEGAAEACWPRYWGYDYRRQPDEPRCAHPQRRVLASAAAATPALPAASVASAASAPADPSSEPAPLAGWEPPSAPPPLPEGRCHGTTLYVQAFGERAQALGERWRQGWQAEYRATVPPVEDVRATARARARAAPLAPRVVELRYRLPAADGSEARGADAERFERTMWCAIALMPLHGLAADRWQLLPLPQGLKARKDVIEVWVPESAVR